MYPQAPACEFLKTSHWLVFLTEFHLIGSNPAHPALANENGPMFFGPVVFLVSEEGFEHAHT